MGLEGIIISNRYEIIEKIGSGGMATVYRAKDRVLNRNVAVKILRDEYTTDIEFIRRFNSEAQSAASLTHPNIVSIYDVGNEANVYYIVMELVQGKTLKEIIIEDGALPWKWSVNVAIQIASALDTAHKNNIIHRDIKPHNIIITEDGVAKVTDFGIAKAASNSTITAFGTTIGSVHYFSPEHARGGFTDSKSDLYSLGVVLYEMVTGRVPFDADTPVSVALKHMQERAIEPMKIDHNIPISVNNIIMKALEKDVTVRYGSALEMIKDLNACLKKPEDSSFGTGGHINDSSTQRVPAIDKLEDKKKKNKILAFFEKHKVLRLFTMFIGAILIFVIVMGITYLIIDANREKDVAIINLVGKTKEEAEEELKKIKVKLELAGEEFDPLIPIGSVISQDPKYRENFTIKEKSTIKVMISKGKETVEAKKVSGMKKDEAIAAIKELGLVEEVVEEKSDTIAEGIVIRQEPLEGTLVDSKSTIKIYVSIGTGIKQVNAPDLIGQTEAEAKILLDALGLKMSVKYDVDNLKPDGKILKQDKEINKPIDEGTTITVTINKIPQITKGTVNIYLKSFTGYTEQKDGNGIVLPSEQVEVVLKVNDEIQYKKSHNEEIEKITTQVDGIGNVTIKLIIDGVTVKQGTLDLGQSNPVLDMRK